MKQCWGITRNLTRCQRSGEWKWFCKEHRRQPAGWIVFLVFTVFAGGIGIYSGIFSSKDISEAKREIVAHQDNSTERILEALRARDKSLKDQLWERYPYGYVLLGSHEGDVVSLPVYRGDMQVSADWGKTKIEIDRERKIVSLLLPQPQWKSDSGPTVRINVAKEASWTGRYVVGTPVRVSLVYVGNQPNMYFEVIDESLVSPVYVIGFKK